MASDADEPDDDDEDRDGGPRHDTVRDSGLADIAWTQRRTIHHLTGNLEEAKGLKRRRVD